MKTLPKILNDAQKLIYDWESRFRDYVESHVLTDRELMFADAIQTLFEIVELLHIEMEKKYL